MEGGESSKMANLNREVALKDCENVIASGTKSMKIKAILMLADYSKQAPEHVLSSFIPSVIEILARNIVNDSVSDLLQEATVSCLKCIACRGDGSLAIEMGEHGVAHSLIKLLPRAEGKMQKVVIECLLVVVSFCETSRTVVATNGGLEIIICLLNSCDTDVRLHLLEILSVLALEREGRKELIRLGALCFIVEAVGVGSMISRERACESIRLLGVSIQVWRTLVGLGVIPVLVELLRVGDNATKLVAGNTLAVVSTYVEFLIPVAEAGAIPLYAELLEGSDDSGKEIAKEVFSVLAVAEANDVEIVGHLVRILREGDDEAKLAVAHVIWDLSAYEHTTSVLRDSGAILILVELLGHGTDDEFKEMVSGAFAQISYNEGGRMVLADAGAIPILVELLDHDMEEIRKNAVEALSNFHEDPLYRDRLSDVVNAPLFRCMQNRLIRIRASNGHMTRSLYRMSVQQLIRNLNDVYRLTGML